jgi:hypothetical protein
VRENLAEGKLGVPRSGGRGPRAIWKGGKGAKSLVPAPGSAGGWPTSSPAAPPAEHPFLPLGWRDPSARASGSLRWEACVSL